MKRFGFFGIALVALLALRLVGQVVFNIPVFFESSETYAFGVLSLLFAVLYAVSLVGVLKYKGWAFYTILAVVVLDALAVVGLEVIIGSTSSLTVSLAWNVLFFLLAFYYKTSIVKR